VADLDIPASPGTLAVADYGAGTGATSVHAMRTAAIKAVRARAQDVPVLAVHNDVLRTAAVRDGGRSRRGPL
jgi:hypothetical protein